MRMNHKEVGALLVTFYLLSYVAISVPLGIYMAASYCNWQLTCNVESSVEPLEPSIKLFPVRKLRSVVHASLNA